DKRALVENVILVLQHSRIRKFHNRSIFEHRSAHGPCRSYHCRIDTFAKRRLALSEQQLCHSCSRGTFRRQRVRERIGEEFADQRVAWVANHQKFPTSAEEFAV